MIPSKLLNLMGYDESDIMVGTVDVTMPNLVYMSEEIQGAGIAGSVDVPALGHFQSLTMGINWRTLIDQSLTFLAGKSRQFTFRGTLQSYDNTTGNLTEQALKIVTRVFPKGINLGTLSVAAGMGTSGEFEVAYIKIDINGKTMVEIDKLNFICIIDGVDYLAESRRNMGLN